MQCRLAPVSGTWVAFAERTFVPTDFEEAELACALRKPFLQDGTG
jgi:hypothetical protein